MRLRTFNQCKQIFPFFPFRWLDLFFVYHSSKHLKQETKKRMQMIKKNILKRRKRNKKGEIDNRLFYFLLLFPPSAPKLPQWGVVVSVANLSGTKWSPHVILFFCCCPLSLFWPISAVGCERDTRTKYRDWWIVAAVAKNVKIQILK